MTLSSLPMLMLEPIVRTALLEDLGRAGDLTTDAIVPAAMRAETALVARQPGIVAGLDAASLAFRLIDPAIEVRVERPDGSRVKPGDRIAVIDGPARGMLTAERVALNFLGHLSGVATATATLVEAVRGHKARICCTRKTMPGLRALQKYAVRAGGGVNHRFGLDDAVSDQGQPCRRGGRRGGGDPRRARGRRPSRQDRGRDRSARPARRGAGGEGRRRAARQYEPRATRRSRAPHRRPRHRRSVGPHHAQPRRPPLRPAAST